MTLIQPRRGTAAQWTTANPVLASGELGVETDTGRSKRGNGSSTWTALPYMLDETGADGRYGRLVVTREQAVAAVDAAVVSAGTRPAFMRRITVNNSAGAEKVNWPVAVSLTSSNFDFSRANTDGSDLVFTSDDLAGHEFPYWVESWDRGAATAKVWVKIPHLAAAATLSIRMGYGSFSARRKWRVSDVFPVASDFSVMPQVSHPDLSAQAVALVADQSWETTSPHTMSVVDFGAGGKQAPNGQTYRYWGFYGLQNNVGSDIGVAFSNDAVAWVKNGPAIISGQALRWPSVIKDDNGLLHMFVNGGAISRIERWTSTDGLAWTRIETNCVAPVADYTQGNPFIFRDPVSHDYFLLYYAKLGGGVTTRNTLQYRRSSDPTALGTAPSIRLMEAPFTLAAPSMVYFDDTYWLYAEGMNDVENKWTTMVFTSKSPAGPFAPSADGLLLAEDEACPFPTIIDGELFLYTCQLNGGTTWDLRVRTAATTKKAPTAAERPVVQPWFPRGAQSIIGITTESGLSVGHVKNTTATDRQVVVFSEHLAPQDFVTAMRVKRVGSTQYLHMWSRADESGSGYRCWVGNTTSEVRAQSNWTTAAAPANSGTHSAALWVSNAYNLVEVESVGSAHKIRLNGTQVLAATDTNRSGSGYIALEATAQQEYFLDWVYVRPYDGADPVVTVGSQLVA